MLFCCVQNSLHILPIGTQYALQQDLYHNNILEIIWSGVEVKALCPSWADTEIVSGVGDEMEDGAERKVAISSIVNVTIIIINILTIINIIIIINITIYLSSTLSLTLSI